MSTEKKRFRNRKNHSMCFFIEALSLVNSLKIFKVCDKLQYSFRGFRNFHAGHRAEKAWTRLVMVAVAVTSEAATACHR